MKTEDSDVLDHLTVLSDLTAASTINCAYRKCATQAVSYKAFYKNRIVGQGGGSGNKAPPHRQKALNWLRPSTHVKSQVALDQPV